MSVVRFFVAFDLLVLVIVETLISTSTSTSNSTDDGVAHEHHLQHWQYLVLYYQSTASVEKLL